MKECFQILSITYGDYFKKHQDFSIVRLSVVQQILCYVYELSVRDNEIIPMEELMPEVKRRLWDIAGKYQSQKEKRINTAKAAYILEVISVNV